MRKGSCQNKVGTPKSTHEALAQYVENSFYTTFFFKNGAYP
jgi:hypothetical protein